MHSAGVGQVVAIHRGDHYILQAHDVDGFGEVGRLQRVDGAGATKADIAKRAAARADVAQDHKGGGAVAEAFGQVGAGGFFADGVQFARVDGFSDLLDHAVVGHAHTNPVGLAQIGALGFVFADGAHLVFGAQLVTYLNFGLVVHEEMFRT